MNKEYRNFNTEFEVDENKVSGYAAVYNSDSRDMGFIETIAPNAFEGRLADDTIATFNHSEDMVLARNSSGTLKLELDEKGLKYEFELPNTTYANNLRELMARGDIYESSFAFTIEDDEWEERSGKFYRTINKIGYLYDVSTVTRGAYADSSSTLRSFEDAKENISKEKENRDIEPVINKNSISAETYAIYTNTLKLKA